MKITLNLDVNGIPTKASEDVVKLLTSCQPSFMYITEKTIEGTIEVQNLNAFADGMIYIKQRYHLQ